MGYVCIDPTYMMSITSGVENDRAVAKLAKCRCTFYGQNFSYPISSELGYVWRRVGILSDSKIVIGSITKGMFGTELG